MRIGSGVLTFFDMKISDCVGRGIFVFVLFFFGSIGVKAQLWVEDFVDEANGATTGTAAGTLGGTWSVTTDPSGTFSVQDDNFDINNTVTEGTWSSNVLDISSAGYAIIDVDYGSVGLGFTASDYIKFYYRIDGGPEILFADVQGDVWDIAAAEASAIVAGNTLQLIIKAVDNSSFFIPIFAGTMWIDQLTVTAAPIIYSRKSGTWTDVSGGVNGTGTWSLTGHTGNACGCYPLNTQVAIIGAGHTVTLATSQTNIGTPPATDLAPGAVDVYGTLQYTAGVTLGIQQGLLRVRSGGTVNSNPGSITGEQVSFNADVGGATLQVDAGGTMSVDDLVVGTAATNLHYLTGGGTLNITDDILVDASDATLTNNRSASFTVTDDLTFNSINSAFTNNATASIGDIVSTDNADDDNVVTNSSGATLTLGGVNANDADLDILNSGTINQSANFSNISNADTNFDNLATGTWNYNFANATVPANLATVLDLSAAGNTFNYGAAGAQRIIPVAHHHIGLSGSGAKDANNASISIKGNWTVSGTATFAEGTGTITLNGSANSQTITNPAGETFNILTINNTYATEPQIILNDNVNITATLNMTDGVIQSDASNILTMLNGSSTTVGAAASYVSGPMRYNMAVNATTRTLNFPIGKNSLYGGASLRVRHTANTPYTYAAEVIASSAKDLNYTLATGTDRVSNLRYWNITRGTTASPTVTSNANLSTGTAGTAPRLTVYYVAEDEVNQPSTLTLVKNVNGGSVWFNTVATATGSPSGSIVTSDPSTNFTSFSFFALANLTGGTNPLPIELSSFDEALKNSEVELKWSTASETNNDNFTIERAIDVEHFEPILTHDGQGTSKELNRYSVVDSSPLLWQVLLPPKRNRFRWEVYLFSVKNN